MDFKELKKMMTEDTKISEDNLAHESLQTSKLYNKYQNIFYDLALQLSELKHKQNEVKLQVQRYWLGQEPDEVYKERPKNTKVLKTDVDSYLKADPFYIDITKKVDQLELQVNHVDQYLKQLSGRNFAIKNAIDYLKFKNGGY